MDGLTAWQPPTPARLGQRAMWLGYDAGLALLFMATAADIPFQWGVSPMAWALIYAAATLRFLSVWPGYFRLLARNSAYLLYPAVCLASVLWSAARGSSLIGGIQITMTVFIACYLGWRFAPRQIVLLAFAVLFMGTTGSFLNLTMGLFDGPSYSAVGGLQGIYANKNTLGHTSLVLMLLALTLILMPRIQVPRLARWLALPAVVMSAVTVVMSKSMTALVLLPIYLAMLFLLNRRRLPAWLRHVAAAGVVVAIAVSPAVMTLAGIDPAAELLAATGKDATLTGRTELWAIAANEFAKVPITGHGYGAFWQAPQFASQRFEVLRAGATSPSLHNVFADVGVGTGLLGLAALLALVLTTLRRAVRFWRNDGTPLAVGCLVTVLLPINLSLVEPYLYRQHEFMLSWLIMLGISLAQHRTLPLQRGHERP